MTWLCRLSLVLSLALVPACGPGEADDDDASLDDDDVAGDDDDASPQSFPCGADEGVVTFDTEDGETLEADYRPGSSSSLGAVVLLHMIPPTHDRSGYPPRVRDEIAEQGVAVLNVDRRGSGGSTGSPEDAYVGEGGRLDVEAAVRFLTSDERDCPIDPTRLVLIGASNGTTSVYDYVVGNTLGLSPDLPFPAAMIFLSPGLYTQNQNALEPNQADRGWSLSFPILGVYPQDETYSEAFVPDAPGAWDFLEVSSHHGTNMFDSSSVEEIVVPALTNWVSAVQ